LLHEELRKSPRARIQEAARRIESGGGWLGGRATEVVLPLLAAPPEEDLASGDPARLSPRDADTRTPATTAALTTSIPASPVKSYPIGSEWLFAKIYGSARLHDEILAEWLPTLLDTIVGHVDRWFFVRYRDPADHIRLRLHGAPDALLNLVLPRLGEWCEQLRDVGLAREWSLHGYAPETVRYGGPALMPAAEAVFQADSEVASAQLRLLRTRGPGKDRDLSLALNMVDIARAMQPEKWATWLVEQVPRDLHRDSYRSRRGELRELVGLTSQDLAQQCGGPETAAAWRSRAEALATYRAELARQEGDGAGHQARSRLLKSLMHMHHNRLRGIASDSEAAAHAVARGFAELTIGAATFGPSRGQGRL
jgi:thiopeptide-type bacteriocin biosynthesis protein